MADVLIIGDSMRCSELRHEVPIAIPDPFLYAEVGGKRLVAVSSMEKARIDDLGTDLEVHALEEFGYDELIARGLTADGVLARGLARRGPQVRRAERRRADDLPAPATPTISARAGSS